MTSCEQGFNTQYNQVASQKCANKPVFWFDIYGHTCNSYEQSSFCKADGTYDTWNPSLGTFNDVGNPDKACCYCGGGIKFQTTSEYETCICPEGSTNVEGICTPNDPTKIIKQKNTILKEKCADKSYTTDRLNYDCNAYADNKICDPNTTDRKGENWNNYYFDPTLLENCCRCGGGEKIYETIPVYSVEECPLGANIVDGQCVCPAESTPQGDKCVCPGGANLVDGQCVCPAEGSIFIDGAWCLCPGNGNVVDGKCICPGGADIVNGECICPGGATLINWNCVCPGGTTMIDRECVCPGGGILVDGKCVCPDISTPVDGKCVCPGESTLVDGKCGCPGESTLVDGKCGCPGESTLVDGKCVCPGESTLVDGKCGCPGESTLIYGKCVCPGGSTLIDGKCVCPGESTLVDGKCKCSTYRAIFANGKCICPKDYKKVGESCLYMPDNIPSDGGDEDQSYASKKSYGQISNFFLICAIILLGYLMIKTLRRRT